MGDGLSEIVERISKFLFTSILKETKDFCFRWLVVGRHEFLCYQRLKDLITY